MLFCVLKVGQKIKNNHALESPVEVGGSVASQKERIYLEFRSWEVNKLSRLIDRVYPDDGKLISQKITPTMSTLNTNVFT